MNDTSANERLLAELARVQNRLSVHFSRFRSMAELSRSECKGLLAVPKRDEDGNGLTVRIRNLTGRELDKISFDYLEARINNLHLANGGARLTIQANLDTIEILKRNHVNDPRMKEIYGDQLQVVFITEDPLSAMIGDNEVPAGVVGTYVHGSKNHDHRPRAVRPRLVVGMDIGGTNIKTILFRDGGIARHDIRKPMILEAKTTEMLLEGLCEALTQIDGAGAEGIGIAWPAPIINGKIVTPIKLPNIYSGEGLSRISDLGSLISRRLGIPTIILNDGAAGALSIARNNGLVDTLCIGLGYSVSAGYISADGNLSPQMELCAAVLGFQDGTAKKVRDFLSLKFGIPAIADMLDLPLVGTTSLEKAEYLVNLSLTEYTEKIGEVFILLGMYLAEMIASTHDIIPMRNAAIFGGLSKNALVVASASRWLKHNHPNIDVKFINTGIDNQFVNAVGAAYAAVDMCRASRESNDGGRENERT